MAALQSLLTLIMHGRLTAVHNLLSLTTVHNVLSLTTVHNLLSLTTVHNLLSLTELGSFRLIHSHHGLLIWSNRSQIM